MRKRRCKGCDELFRIEGVKIKLNWYHDFSCATAYATIKSRQDAEKAAKKQDKQDKKSHAKAKRELKDNDKSFQTKKTQTIFNRFIRLRDSDEPCISCGNHHTGRYDAGHYLSAGAYPELRFHPLNCHKQCHYNCFAQSIAPAGDALRVAGGLLFLFVRFQHLVGLVVRPAPMILRRSQF
jgi:hypothetical protein